MKEVVKINNEQEWEYVKNKINNPASLVDFKRYEITKDICINIHNGQYDYVDYYIIHGYEIISFNEFKSRYETQLKIGDTFEKDGFVCRVESEVEKWVYDKYQEAYYKTKEWYSNYIVITNKEFIAQLEKYSQ